MKPHLSEIETVNNSWNAGAVTAGYWRKTVSDNFKIF